MSQANTQYGHVPGGRLLSVHRVLDHFENSDGSPCLVGELVDVRIDFVNRGVQHRLQIYRHLDLHVVGESSHPWVCRNEQFEMVLCEDTVDSIRPRTLICGQIPKDCLATHEDIDTVGRDTELSSGVADLTEAEVEIPNEHLVGYLKLFEEHPLHVHSQLVGPFSSFELCESGWAC